MTAASKHIGSTFKHALVYSASGMIGKAIGFIMLPVYAHYLRGEGYGMIGMIDVVLSVVTLLLGYGVQGAMTRFYYEKKTELERKELVSTAIILMFFLVVLVSLPVLLFKHYSRDFTLLRLLYYFVLLNVASLHAVIKFIQGTKQVV